MFIARQPIFTNRMDVYGYELLYRAHKDSVRFEGVSPMTATAGVLEELFEAGVEHIVGEKRAFVNFGADFLKADWTELLDSRQLIIELMPDVVPDDALVARVKQLKQKGYYIALDAFGGDYEAHPLIPYADIVKFDLMERPLESLMVPVKQALQDRKILLAEKIETQGEFDRALAMGFHLFQGFFFSKPDIVEKATTRETSLKSQYALILNELKKEEPSYRVMAEIIEHDVNLAYRLLRVVSGRAEDNLVLSIRRALAYMGLKEIERWINILMIQDIGNSKPRELMAISLVRTKFSEAIAVLGHKKQLKDEAAMMGLFSMLDAMLDQSMEEALGSVALAPSVKEALIYHRGELMPILNLVRAYEQGNWELSGRLCQLMEIDSEHLSALYVDAVKWANETVQAMYLKE